MIPELSNVLKLDEPHCVAALREMYERRDAYGFKVFDFNADGIPFHHVCTSGQNLAALYFFLSCPDVDVTWNNNEAFYSAISSHGNNTRNDFYWYALWAFLEDRRVLDNASGMAETLWRLYIGLPWMLPIVASCLSQAQWRNICHAVYQEDQINNDKVGICAVFCPRFVSRSSEHFAARRRCWLKFEYYRLVAANLWRPCVYMPNTSLLRPTLQLVYQKHCNSVEHQNTVACETLTNVCLALFPLRLPSYVLLWIIEWLPDMYDDDGKPCLKELDVLQRIININQLWFKRKQRDKNKRV